MQLLQQQKYTLLLQCIDPAAKELNRCSYSNNKNTLYITSVTVMHKT